MEKVNETLKQIQDLTNNEPNNQVLGAKVRELVKTLNKSYLDVLKEENAQRKKKSAKQKEHERMIKLLGQVVLPYNSTLFRTMLFNWIEYKRIDHNFKYKSVISLQAALKKLSELSKGSEEKAIAIMSQSIENGWKGFFELKQVSNGQANNRISEDYKQGVINDLLD